MSEGSLNENIVAVLIIKIVEKVQEETNRGRFMLYSPEAIHLLGYSAEHPEQVKIKLGDPINRTNESQRMYLSPEVLRGEVASEKSCVFNIAVIWDEILHGDLYFHSTDEIENAACNFPYNSDEYRVRNNRINPIFKNCLFDMLTKDSRRRMAFTEIRRRLSLQQFIVLEEEGQHEQRRNR